MTHPAYTESEALAHDTFMALMWSLSYPGKIYELPQSTNSSFHLIADTLLDIETSFYCSDSSLIGYFSKNGARELNPERASYHFYPILTDDMLETVKEASTGTLMYPDQSATLIIGAKFSEGLSLKLTGPGINPASPNRIQVDGISPAFLELRDKAIRYPRGWDIYLVDCNQVIGLPRTTIISIEE